MTFKVKINKNANLLTEKRMKAKNPHTWAREAIQFFDPEDDNKLKDIPGASVEGFLKAFADNNNVSREDLEYFYGFANISGVNPNMISPANPNAPEGTPGREGNPEGRYIIQGTQIVLQNLKRARGFRSWFIEPFDISDESPKKKPRVEASLAPKFRPMSYNNVEVIPAEDGNMSVTYKSTGVNPDVALAIKINKAFETSDLKEIIMDPSSGAKDFDGSNKVYDIVKIKTYLKHRTTQLNARARAEMAKKDIPPLPDTARMYSLRDLVNPRKKGFKAGETQKAGIRFYHEVLYSGKSDKGDLEYYSHMIFKFSNGYKVNIYKDILKLNDKHEPGEGSIIPTSGGAFIHAMQVASKGTNRRTKPTEPEEAESGLTEPEEAESGLAPLDSLDTPSMDSKDVKESIERLVKSAKEAAYSTVVGTPGAGPQNIIKVTPCAVNVTKDLNLKTPFSQEVLAGAADYVFGGMAGAALTKKLTSNLVRKAEIIKALDDVDTDRSNGILLRMLLAGGRFSKITPLIAKLTNKTPDEIDKVLRDFLDNPNTQKYGKLGIGATALVGGVPGTALAVGAGAGGAYYWLVEDNYERSTAIGTVVSYVIFSRFLKMYFGPTIGKWKATKGLMKSAPYLKLAAVISWIGTSHADEDFNCIVKRFLIGASFGGLTAATPILGKIFANRQVRDKLQEAHISDNYDEVAEMYAELAMREFYTPAKFETAFKATGLNKNMHNLVDFEKFEPYNVVSNRKRPTRKKDRKKWEKERRHNAALNLEIAETFEAIYRRARDLGLDYNNPKNTYNISRLDPDGSLGFAAKIKKINKTMRASRKDVSSFEDLYLKPMNDLSFKVNDKLADLFRKDLIKMQQKLTKDLEEYAKLWGTKLPKNRSWDDVVKSPEFYKKINKIHRDMTRQQIIKFVEIQQEAIKSIEKVTKQSEKLAQIIARRYQPVDLGLNVPRETPRKLYSPTASPGRITLPGLPKSARRSTIEKAVKLDIEKDIDFINDAILKAIKESIPASAADKTKRLVNTETDTINRIAEILTETELPSGNSLGLAKSPAKRLQQFKDEPLDMTVSRVQRQAEVRKFLADNFDEIEAAIKETRAKIMDLEYLTFQLDLQSNGLTKALEEVSMLSLDEIETGVRGIAKNNYTTVVRSWIASPRNKELRNALRDEMLDAKKILDKNKKRIYDVNGSPTLSSMPAVQQEALTRTMLGHGWRDADDWTGKATKSARLAARWTKQYSRTILKASTFGKDFGKIVAAPITFGVAALIYNTNPKIKDFWDLQGGSEEESIAKREIARIYMTFWLEKMYVSSPEIAKTFDPGSEDFNADLFTDNFSSVVLENIKIDSNSFIKFLKDEKEIDIYRFFTNPSIMVDQFLNPMAVAIINNKNHFQKTQKIMKQESPQNMDIKEAFQRDLSDLNNKVNTDFDSMVEDFILSVGGTIWEPIPGMDDEPLDSSAPTASFRFDKDNQPSGVNWLKKYLPADGDGWRWSDFIPDGPPSDEIVVRATRLDKDKQPGSTRKSDPNKLAGWNVSNFAVANSDNTPDGKYRKQHAAYMKKRSNQEKMRPVAQAVRKISNIIFPGEKIYITSGYRSPEYNDIVVKATKGSRHKRGDAIDFTPAGWSNLSRKKKWEKFKKISDLMHQGIVPQGGLGIYSGHIHYDNRGKLRRWYAKIPKPEGWDKWYSQAKKAWEMKKKTKKNETIDLSLSSVEKIIKEVMHGSENFTKGEIKDMKKSDLKEFIKETLKENSGQGYSPYPYGNQVRGEEEPNDDYMEEWKSLCTDILRDESRDTAVAIAKILVKDLELFEDVLELAGENQSVGSVILDKLKDSKEVKKSTV